MFGIPKKWLDAGSRAAAGAGLVTNVLGSGVPPMVKANTDAGKQFANYSKEVRLPETRRDINRTLQSGGRLNNAYKLAGTQQITRKDRKNIKKS